MIENITKTLSDARRIIDLERRMDKESVKGDFSGTVVAYYKAKNKDGTVTVVYDSRDYVARPMAKYMAVKGDVVSLSYRAGIYLASW